MFSQGFRKVAAKPTVKKMAIGLKNLFPVNDVHPAVQLPDGKGNPRMATAPLGSSMPNQGTGGGIAGNTSPN